MSNIYVNRILNLRQIKAIGLDMDHTIVRYHSEKFEALTFKELKNKLISLKKYPEAIRDIPFEYKRAIRGLVIDKKNGNLVKLSLYGRVKMAHHGLHPLDYSKLNEHYHGLVIDLNDSDYQCIDTSFSIGEAILFAHLVELKDAHPHHNFPSYETISKDIKDMLDLSHRDGSLKNVVKDNLSEYIIQDPEIPRVLEEFKLAGKTIIVITNSDFHYTNTLLNYTFNPFLKKHSSWMELFDYTITLAEKPSFFSEKRRFLQINPVDGTMTNLEGNLFPGIFQGGSANYLQKHLQMSGEEILYIGDHIFGDILQLKKVCNWRTALVMEEIIDEVEASKRARSLIDEIDRLMVEKEKIERTLHLTMGDLSPRKNNAAAFEQIKAIDDTLKELLEKYQVYFNPYWGEVMRAGQEESRFMGQVAKYACIYMAKISDFVHYSTKHYFRPRRRPLPHETRE